MWSLLVWLQDVRLHYLKNINQNLITELELTQIRAVTGLDPFVLSGSGKAL